MKKLNDVALRLLAKAAYVNAKKEADSACLYPTFHFCNDFPVFSLAFMI